MAEGRNTFKILPSNPTGKRTLGRPRHRWENNIRIYLKAICVSTGNWIDLTQDGIIGGTL
jgi:hypothetical protein